MPPGPDSGQEAAVFDQHIKSVMSNPTVLIHSTFLLTTLIAVNMGLVYLFYLLPIWEGWHSFYHPRFF